MIGSYLDLVRILLESIGLLIILLLIFRRHILSVFDPLFIYLVTQAFSIELAFLQIGNVQHVINFLCCQVAFSAGFILCAGRSLQSGQSGKTLLLEANPKLISQIKLFAIISCIVVVLCNMYLIKTTGFAILAEDPSAAKTETFIESGGLGIIRRINWGMLYVTALILLYLYFYKKQITYLLLAALLLLVLVVSGSKGALLYFIALIPLLQQFRDIKSKPQFRVLNRSKYILFGGGFVLALFIVFVGLQGTLDDAIFGLGSRFLFFGDAMLYYYDKFSVAHFSTNNFRTFLYDELNGPLGFLRLVPYEKPLGFKMVDYQLMFEGSTVFGPNVPYYVKGHIYFGPAGAIIYAFCIGALVGLARKTFYTLLHQPSNILSALFIIHLNVVIYNLPQDSQLFIGVLFDTILLSLPIYLFAIIYLYGNPKILQPVNT